MTASDIVTAVFRPANAVRVVDRWASMRSRPAIDDDVSQVQDLFGSAENGRIYVRFTRTVATSDSMDLPLDQPRYFLFAWGELSPGGDITYHGANRYISDKKILATQCGCIMANRG